MSKLSPDALPCAAIASSSIARSLISSPPTGAIWADRKFVSCASLKMEIPSVEKAERNNEDVSVLSGREQGECMFTR